ncbi:ATP-binding protein [Actinoplanes sp. ATCC 53533]|uniref:ATP-binding protein n=1 Tax=Actinoplanes sp. ATCC 53533 TaxID=1288362 RepID=UPI000F770FC6|nr:ATP-binding protein [Actinoplanes sp. ATCC 53533]
MSGELKPPYLIRRARARREGSVSVTADVDAGVIEVAVRGRWSPSLRVEAWTAVTKCFVEHPLAVIVDLHDLDDPLASSAPAWWTMGITGARLAPPVSVVVCLPLTTALTARLNRLGAKRYLPVFTTLPDARAAVAGRLPLTQRVRVHLPPQPGAVITAGALIADACEAWQLPRLRHPAGLIICELVDNAVKHAGTAVVATVARRGAGIHLAVSDEDPRLPVVADPAPRGRHAWDEGSPGLRAVHAAATVWGAMPTATGKVIWAVVRPGPG